MKPSIATLSILPLLGTVVSTQTASPAKLPSDAEVNRVLSDRIDVQHQGVGIVVGLIDATGRRIVSHGTFDGGGSPQVGGDTVFEIGSATKVFTSLLLADAVQRGEVALADPVSKYLPPGVTVPARGGRQITLEDLATHTSGLPRLPNNLTPKNAANPYADYTEAQLYAFLSSYALPRDIGSTYEYSNLGAGLLGHALARRAGMDYETLVRTRITGPLGMKDTVVTVGDALKPRFASGHDATRARVANWDLATLSGAGALRSTANDLLTFLSAALGYTPSPLAPALASMIAVRHPTGTAGLEVGLAWHILSRSGGNEIVWHNGGTGGYRSYMAFSPKDGTGVVILSNTSTTAGVDDIGRHFLDPVYPLLAPPVPHTEISLAPEVLDRYVGKYQLAPTFAITVTRENGRLFIQATAQPKLEVFPSAEREFFLKVVEAQITFEINTDGKVTGLVLHQNGVNQRAQKVE